MKEITDKKFMELSYNQGTIDVDHMSDDLRKSLASVGLNEAELRKIADTDGKITGKEFQKLFEAVDRFDSNPSKTSFDYYEKSSSSKSPVLSKSGQLYEAMSSEVQRNRITASYPGSAIVPASKDPIVGRQIAVLASGTKSEPVKVTKEFGPPGGFATRYEALALARGANSGSAAIFQDDTTKRWYAVETNTSLNKATSTWSPESSKISHLEPAGKPDLVEWANARKKVDELKAKGKTLNDFELRGAYGDMIAVALGVPKTEINIMKSDKDTPDPKKINFNPDLGSLGRSGPAKLDGKPHTIQIGIGELSSATPFNLIGTVHHEATHVHHHARGNELLKQWEGTDKSKTFGRWLDEQYQKKKITLEERETITEEYKGRTGPTEAISYLNTFMATFAVDRTDKSDDLLLNSNLKQAGRYLLNSDLEKELLSRLEYFYRGLDDADRTRFQKVMDKFKKDNPTSWLAKFQY